jgi:hypothetical protein
MKCKKTDSAVIGYLFKTLSPEAEKRMGKHLALCSECRARLDRFKRTQKLLDTITCPAPPDRLARKALNRIASQRNKGQAENRKNTPDIPLPDYIEALSKTAGSELMRVYAFLTRHLGLEKGETAFDEYLKEQMQLYFTTETGTVITYEHLINTATGERSVKRTEGRTTCSTVENCSFPALAEEIGLSTNPCATICRRQIRLIEKMRSVEITCLRHRTHKKGGCEFQIKPAGKGAQNEGT